MYKSSTLLLVAFTLTQLAVTAKAEYCHSPSCTPGAPGYIPPSLPTMQTPVCHSATCAPKTMYAPTKPDDSRIRHIVCFKYKDEVSSEEISEVAERFRNLKKQIPYILSLVSGTNNSPENQSHGYSACFIVGFKSAEDRDYYVYKDSIHKVFKDFVGPLLDQVFVFDFADGK